MVRTPLPWLSKSLAGSLVGSLAGLCSISCSWIARAPDVPPFADAAKLGTGYFERALVRPMVNAPEQPTLMLAPDAALHVPGRDDVAAQVLVAGCLARPPLLRFAWLSDVQLRQREVKLFNSRMSRDLDRIIPSFESDPVQEEYDWAVYLGHVLALNSHQAQRGAGPPLAFSIHSGDSVDAGTIEELYQFVYISNQLQMPWFNLLGNHDVGVFGNYDKSKNYTLAAGVEFYPVATRGNFQWMHNNLPPGMNRVTVGFGPELLPVPSETHQPSFYGCVPSGDPARFCAVETVPQSRCHGFDLAPGGRDEQTCAQQKGYYAFDLKEQPVRVIALDTPRKTIWGAGAEVPEEQTRWLRQTLADARGRVKLVFAHHRPGELPAEMQAVLSEAAARGKDGEGSLVLFTGHVHQNLLGYYGEGGRGYHELNAGALMDYPQLGRIVELRGAPGGEGCLVTRAAWSSFAAPSADALKPHPLTPGELAQLRRCEEDRDGMRKTLADSVRCGHLGAVREFLGGRERPWGKPQRFAASWRNANVVIPALVIPTR